SRGGVRGSSGAAARAADLRVPVPGRALAARSAQRCGSALRRPFRAVRRAARDRECVLGAERPRRPARALRRADARTRRRRPRGARHGRRLSPRARARAAADARCGNRRRPAGDAPHRRHLDPRGDSLPAAPSRGGAVRWELFVGLRYLRARRRSFLSLISFISLLGVTIGVATLDIVLAVMTGFEQDLRDKILGMNPHVVVVSYAGPAPADPTLVEKVRGVDGVAAAAPFVYGQAMLAVGRSAAGVVVRGIDPQMAGA